MSLKSEEYKLSIRLMTYMHESFIKEAMDGIMMQKINFKVEVVVGDDFSTDRTLDIIKSYQNTKQIHIKILQRQKGDAYWKKRQELGRLYNFVNILENCTGNYIALLDGDDYWVDPLKLQKQVDFLEANQAYGVVHTDTHVYYQNIHKLVKNINKINKRNQIKIDNPAEDIILGSYVVYTLTGVFKRSLLDKIDFNVFYKFKIGDLPLWLALTQFTKFFYLSESTATYRKFEGSISNPTNKKSKLDYKISSKEVRLYFANTLNLKTSIVNDASDQYNRAILRNKFENNESFNASKMFFSLHKKTLKDVILLLGCKSKVFNTVVKKALPNMS
ncbi:glycosyltransferase [Psychroserpens mesophilus]|uniref:glycosyltransferase n=1 Tax=Psychroserpens mesophilus TaxID=325473 RepID=UPI003D655EB8